MATDAAHPHLFHGSRPPTQKAKRWTESAPVIAKLAEMVRTTVTQAMANAIPSTDNTNRSGRRRMLASANRIKHPKVPPVRAAVVAI